MNLSNKKIDSIAQDVDMGMNVYLHRKTSETIKIPDAIEMGMGDPELWQEDIREVEDHREDYILLQDMPSRQAYRVMEDFVSNIEDEMAHTVLDVVLNNAKPFRNFKNTLNRYPEIREEWFAFKQERMNRWVAEQIEAGDFTF